MQVAFIEKKSPNMARVAELLEASAASNMWANRGPVYRALQSRFTEHLGVSSDLVAVPLANGGVALEAMARLHASRAGRHLRWVASAYSFQNLGRGYFSDIRFVDCDTTGLISLEALCRLEVNSYDGIVVTNPFGLHLDFSRLAEFARSCGKVLLIDNASGVHSKVPDLPWQAFSLHHTKPYGVGEGGLALVPLSAAEDLYEIVNYAADISDELRPHWFENGKLSDISAAFLVDRLERLAEWGPAGVAQRERITEIAAGLGLKPLALPMTDIPLTSMPFVAKVPIRQEMVDATRHAIFAKYYRPLADLPVVTDIFTRLVNVPCHRDMAALSDAEIAADLTSCMETGEVRKLRPFRNWTRTSSEDMSEDYKRAQSS